MANNKLLPLIACIGMVGAALADSAHAQPPAVVGNPAGTIGAGPTACSALLHQTFNRLQDDVPQDLCQYAGKVALVVNTAS